MTELPRLDITAPDLDALAVAEGRVVVFVPGTGQFDQMSRRVNRLTKGAVQRYVASEDFQKMKEGQIKTLAYPAGLAAKAVDIVRMERRTRGEVARKAGGGIGNLGGDSDVLIAAGSFRGLNDVCLGLLLSSYRFTDHKTDTSGTDAPSAAFQVMTPRHEELGPEMVDATALARGIYLTRDLINEPSNVLTTTEFADRLAALSDFGLKVEVLEEADLEKLGMRTLLAVGQGSESPSKVVIMEWTGGDDDTAPIALIGKGVTFDTGGISIKPAGGMEAMTMDMGGAGTVAGAMTALASRKARVNAVGLVGIVENMPDGGAMRPGDIIRTMKGDTVEVVNTDAEGRLVLADVLWYAAERFNPRAMVDLATLTGAVVVALGHHNAGLFSNDDALASDLQKAADTEGEGLWRLPLGTAYAEQLKSRFADVKNSGSRHAGATTAAEFLRRFVKEGTPWAHLDIAGVTVTSTEKPLSPKGATGWGVRTLDRWIRGMEDDG